MKEEWSERPSNGSMRAVKTWVIVNPKAGSGRAADKGRQLAEALADARVLETQSAGDATRIARQAEAEGVDVIVPVGGDGTIQQCVAGLCLTESGQARVARTRLSLCPSGTGGDFRRTFSMSESIDHALTRLQAPNPRTIDVGRVQYTNQGKTEVTAFANVLSFGLGGLTDQIVEGSPKWLGGKAAFFLGAARATLVHQPLPVELVLDGRALEIAPYSNVAICNGSYFGGGMKIAPDAEVDDGFFEVITMELGKAKTLSLAAHIYRGTHLQLSGVKRFRARQVQARCTRVGDSLIDVDGEQLGTLPLSIEVMPGALQLLT